MKKEMIFLLCSILALSMLQVIVACGDDDDDDDDDDADDDADDDDDAVTDIPHEEYLGQDCESCHADDHDDGNFPSDDCTSCHSYAS